MTMSTRALMLRAACSTMLLLAALGEGGRAPVPEGAPDSLVINIPHLARGTGRLAIDEVPENIAAYVGQTVVFRCSVILPPPSSRLMWTEFITIAGGNVISDNNNTLAHPNRDRYFIINPTAREFHLQITDIRLADGGRYACQDSLAGPPDAYRAFAMLVVIAAPPNCTNTAPSNGNVIVGQHHTIECQTSYQGPFSPTKTWSGPDPFEVLYPPATPTTVWAGIRYDVTKEMDISFFQCLTNFTNTGVGTPPDDTATNIPMWNYLYRAPQMFVSWGPMNLTAFPIKPEYAVGDLITCSADAKPAAVFQWQNMRTNLYYYNAVYIITEDQRGFNDQLRCQAQNLIQGTPYSDNIFINAYVPPLTTPTTTLPTTPTTTFPPVSNCETLTGRWRCDEPYAEAILHVVDGDQMGRVEGLMMNRSDTFWVEVIGITRVEDYSYLALSAIWPYDTGVTSICAECHRCNGVEVLHIDGMWKSIHASPTCGAVAPQTPYPSHVCYRIGSVGSALAEPLRVWRPSKVSKRLGVTLKK